LCSRLASANDGDDSQDYDRQPMAGGGRSPIGATCTPASGACGKQPLADGGKCDDGSLCTQVDTCKAGKCVGGDAKSCTGDACNVGKCNPASGQCGLSPKADGTGCQDGNDCTTKDGCLAGKCQAGTYTCACKENKDCGDDNKCTKDECVDAGGKKSCKNTITAGASCNDGKACTKTDACTSKGACVGKAINCLDGVACTDDYCQTSTGKCINKPKTGSSCGDSDPCTKNDKCDATGKCTGQAVTCNDNKVCTSDACVKGQGCKYTPKNSGKCDDGSKCTTSDACSIGACKGKTVNCDDKNACTADSCDKSKGCKYTSTNQGKYCANTRLCWSGKCICKYASITTGISPASAEELWGVLPHTSGGVIAVGRRYKTGVGHDGLCQVVDGGNAITKSVTINGSSKGDQLRAIIPFDSKYWLAAGYMRSGSHDRGWLVKLDGNCSKKASVWHSDVSAKHQLKAITSDGGSGAWAVGLRKDPLPNTQFGWLLHVDSNLKKLSSKIIGEPLKKTTLNGIQRDDKGNYIVVGQTTAKSAGAEDGSASLIDKNGKQLWWKRYGTSASDKFQAVAVDGGSAWIVGYTEKNDASSGQDAWVVKINLFDGKALVDKVHVYSGDDQLLGITIKGSTRIAVGRKTGAAGHIVRLSSSGSYEKSIIGGGSGVDSWQGVTFAADGRVFTAGYYYNTGTKSQNPWVRSFGGSLEFTCK